MKILNRITKTRRKLRVCFDFLIKYRNKQKENQRYQGFIKILRKKYINKGANGILLNKYSLGYDFEPYLERLSRQGDLLYNKIDTKYEITIKDDG